MKTFTRLILIIAGLQLFGCSGEKLAIPQPEGLFSINVYYAAGNFDIDDPRQLVVANGVVFVIHGNTLSKRDQGLQLVDGVDPVSTFGNPTALCADSYQGLIFVFDQAASTVSWYNPTGLEFIGSTTLSDVQSGVSMATNSSGVGEAPAAQTFLYLSDPVSEVVHRFAFDVGTGLTPFGILARANGESARFIHTAAGLVSEPGGTLLACDADSLRNWVIRFDSSPDPTDTTVDPDDQDPLRGLPVPVRDFDCLPLPTAAYVLGDAPVCGESDWVGAPSDSVAEFSNPEGVAVDGSGRIFVSDTGNNRVQIFNEGELEQLFVINTDGESRPTSIGVLDRVVSPFLTHFAAYIYVVLPEENMVRKFISYDEYKDVNAGPPPPPQ